MLSPFPGLFSSQVKSLEPGGSMNHGFIEVSHSSYGHLSLVAVGSRKGSACQAPGLQKRKRWQREKKGKHLCCRPLPSQRSLAPGKKSCGEKCLCSQLQGWFFWCMVPHLSFSSLLLSPFQLRALTLPPHPSLTAFLSACSSHPRPSHSGNPAPLLHQLPWNLSGSVSVHAAFCGCGLHILFIVSTLSGIKEVRRLLHPK